MQTSSSARAPVCFWLRTFYVSTAFLVVSFIILASCLFLYFRNIYLDTIEPDLPLEEAISLSGSEFSPVHVGNGYRREGRSIVTDFSDSDDVVLAIGTSFFAESYPFIKVNLAGLTRFSKAKLMWQRTDDPQVYSVELRRVNKDAGQAAMFAIAPEYTGKISSLAVLIYDGPALNFEKNRDNDITLKSIDLIPFSMKALILQVLSEWSNPPVWAGDANNKVLGSHSQALIQPNIVLTLMFLFSTFMVTCSQKFCMQGRSQNRFSVLAVIMGSLIICFVLNQSLRAGWLLEQIIDTHDRYTAFSVPQRILSNEVRCSRFPQDCAAELLPFL